MPREGSLRRLQVGKEIMVGRVQQGFEQAGWAMRGQRKAGAIAMRGDVAHLRRPEIELQRCAARQGLGGYPIRLGQQRKVQIVGLGRQHNPLDQTEYLCGAVQVQAGAGPFG